MHAVHARAAPAWIGKKAKPGGPFHVDGCGNTFVDATLQHNPQAAVVSILIGYGIWDTVSARLALFDGAVRGVGAPGRVELVKSSGRGTGRLRFKDEKVWAFQRKKACALAWFIGREKEPGAGWTDG